MASKIWLEEQEEKKEHTLARIKQDQLATVNLEEKGEEKIVKISVELEKDFKQQLVGLMKEHKDVFASSFLDMEGINPKFYQHKINVKEKAIPIKQQRYIMNSNCAKLVKEEIDWLVRIGFIYPVKKTTWISPIVIVPKKKKL